MPLLFVTTAGLDKGKKYATMLIFSKKYSKTRRKIRNMIFYLQRKKSPFHGTDY